MARVCPKCGKGYPADAEFCVKDGERLRDDGAVPTPGAGLTPGAWPTPVPGQGGVFAEGTIVGSYRILDVLGKGGMGIVYRAQHVRLGRKVAIKVLRPELSADALLIRRFFDEARAANQVGHENVVEISDFVDEGEHRYYVMELLEGEPLSTPLVSGKPMPLKRTFHIARQVADALAALHDKGIVHRDLKPDNIFLTQRARQRDFVKLLDFGVAKVLDRVQGRDAESADDASPRTQAGVVIGTPAYMSPEQLMAEPIDHRADLYSFGVILYQMVTGVRPFRAKSIPELMMLHCTQPPKPPSTVPHLPPHAVPAALEELILSCLEKKAAKRPADMRAVDDALAALELELAPQWTPPPADVSGSGPRMRTKARAPVDAHAEAAPATALDGEPVHDDDDGAEPTALEVDLASAAPPGIRPSLRSGASGPSLASPPHVAGEGRSALPTPMPATRPGLGEEQALQLVDELAAGPGPFVPVHTEGARSGRGLALIAVAAVAVTIVVVAVALTRVADAKPVVVDATAPSSAAPPPAPPAKSTDAAPAPTDTAPALTDTAPAPTDTAPAPTTPPAVEPTTDPPPAADDVAPSGDTNEKAGTRRAPAKRPKKTAKPKPTSDLVDPFGG